VPKGNWYCLTCGGTSYSEADIAMPQPSLKERIYPAVSTYASELAAEFGAATRKIAHKAGAGLHTIFFVDTPKQRPH